MQNIRKPITIKYKLFQDWKKGAFSEISIGGLSMILQIYKTIFNANEVWHLHQF
jgi:hypothetical protein